MGLFVLSALVPLVAMAGVSFLAVNKQLEDHSQERLGQLARNAGQSITQQLRGLETTMFSVAERLARGQSTVTNAQVLSPAIVKLAVEDADGRLTPPSSGSYSRRPLTGSESEVLSERGMIVRVHPNEGQELTVGVAIDPTDASAGTLWARVHADSIWSPAVTFSSLPSTSDFCLLLAPGQPLFCTSGTDRFATGFEEAGSTGPLGTFTQDEGREQFLVGYWSFYPTSAFDAPPWTVLVAESAEAVYAPLDGFTTLFGLTLLLAFLLVVLLSQTQIRRTMQPLEALETGTSRIAAGDLETRVAVETNDEFGALAGSFNSMAGRLGAQFRQFEAVEAVGRSALAGFDRDEVIITALNELPAISLCRSAAILLAPPRDGTGEIKWLTGPSTLGGTSASLGTDDLQWLRANAPHGTISDDPPAFADRVRAGLGRGPLTVFPHLIKGRIQGATIIEHEVADPPLEDEVAQRVRQIADQLAVALDDVRLVKELEDLSWGTLRALARAIDAKSEWTSGHSERVTEMALGLAREMGFGKDDMDIVHRGGLLHDIGKIGVPNEILDYEGKLSAEDFAVVQQHPAIGARILEPIGAFAPAIPLVLQHHESWDGTGYPQGLAGEAIHPLARVLSVADTYDAMTSARPYRRGRPPAAVLDEISSESGRQFDPGVVDALARYLHRHWGDEMKKVAHAGA